MSELMFDIIDRQRKIAQEREDLMNKLEVSLALQAAWPDAFANGPCSSSLIVHPGPKPMYHDVTRYSLRLTNGNGEQHTLKGDEIPDVVLRNSMRLAGLERMPDPLSRYDVERRFFARMY